ncbi:MAG: DivIVA domain-containing protein [Actinomycetota bacterium]
MELTPKDIEDKQFHDSFRGYNHEEVDLFLDEMAESFARLQQEQHSLRQRLQELQEQLKQARGTEDMLKRTMLYAQRTAEDTVEEAKVKAQGMVSAAERRSQEIIALAERRSQEIINAGAARERELDARVDGLRRFEQEYRERLQAFLESQLRVLSEGPAAAPPRAPADGAAHGESRATSAEHSAAPFPNGAASAPAGPTSARVGAAVPGHGAHTKMASNPESALPGVRPGGARMPERQSPGGSRPASPASPPARTPPPGAPPRLSGPEESEREREERRIEQPIFPARQAPRSGPTGPTIPFGAVEREGNDARGSAASPQSGDDHPADGAASPAGTAGPSEPRKGRPEPRREEHPPKEPSIKELFWGDE